MIRRLLAASAFAGLAVLAFGQTPAFAQATTQSPSQSTAQNATQSVPSQAAYSFEFFDFQANNVSAAFPFGHTNEVIVASQTQDVRNQLPISLSLKIDSNEKWTATIPNNPTQTCRGATGCSTHGPVISDPGTNAYFELTARGKSNQLLTTYARGLPSTSTSKTATQTTQTQPANQSDTSTKPDTSHNLSNNWWRWWWTVGFWVGILWLFLWIFVGWQWARYKFWGFGWPWPWWFWIPLIWFIPWLIIAWVWWLEWWDWWIWIWWLFPWIFWWFWWLVIFKEAIIWLWRQDRH